MKKERKKVSAREKKARKNVGCSWVHAAVFFLLSSWALAKQLVTVKIRVWAWVIYRSLWRKTFALIRREGEKRAARWENCTSREPRRLAKALARISFVFAWMGRICAETWEIFEKLSKRLRLWRRFCNELGKISHWLSFLYCFIACEKKAATKLRWRNWRRNKRKWEKFPFAQTKESSDRAPKPTKLFSRDCIISSSLLGRSQRYSEARVRDNKQAEKLC